MEITLYAIAVVAASFGLYKYINRNKRDKDLFHAVKTVYRPLYIKLMGKRPIVITNLDQVIRERIELSLYNRINSSIYRSHIIKSEIQTQVELIYNQENFMPMSYQEGFIRLYKETTVKVIAEFEKAGYDIETSVSPGRIMLLIRPKIRDLVKK